MRISDWSSDVCTSDLFILKPNRGGKGLGVRPFADADALAAYLAAPEFEEPLDGIHLLQEHVATPEPVIAPAAFVGGRLLYAVEVDTAVGFTQRGRSPGRGRMGE